MFFGQEGFTLIKRKDCIWSKKARQLLKKHGVPFVEIHVSLHNDASKDSWGYKSIKSKYRHQTFPICYDKKGKLIGGYEKIKEYFISKKK